MTMTQFVKVHSHHHYSADGPLAMGARGYCRRCGKEHRLGPGNTERYCRTLMDHLARHQTLQLLPAKTETDRRLDTATLFGPARGKMFGVLEYQRSDGTTGVIKAFSGQYNGLWSVEGWVPPLFAIEDFYSLTVETEKTIKQLGRKIDACQPHSSSWLSLRKERRLASRALMRQIHGLYTLNNFRGETATLEQAFIGPGGIPTGTGDCCAPKLLDFAARNTLRPLGISEFFWGKENKSGGHQHGEFASSCTEKCQPILGFLLCGLDQASP